MAKGSRGGQVLALLAIVADEQAARRRKTQDYAEQRTVRDAAAE